MNDINAWSKLLLMPRGHTVSRLLKTHDASNRLMKPRMLRKRLGLFDLILETTKFPAQWPVIITRLKVYAPVSLSCFDKTFF